MTYTTKDHLHPSIPSSTIHLKTCRHYFSFRRFFRQNRLKLKSCSHVLRKNVGVGIGIGIGVGCLLYLLHLTIFGDIVADLGMLLRRSP